LTLIIHLIHTERILSYFPILLLVTALNTWLFGPQMTDKRQAAGGCPQHHYCFVPLLGLTVNEHCALQASSSLLAETTLSLIPRRILDPNGGLRDPIRATTFVHHVVLHEFELHSNTFHRIDNKTNVIGHTLKHRHHWEETQLRRPTVGPSPQHARETVILAYDALETTRILSAANSR